jgi:transposase
MKRRAQLLKNTTRRLQRRSRLCRRGAGDAPVIRTSSVDILCGASPDQTAQKRERDPWLLVASCALSMLSVRQIVTIYSKRMQIEQSFRDLKCERFGCALYYIPCLMTSQ